MYASSLEAHIVPEVTVRTTNRWTKAVAIITDYRRNSNFNQDLQGGSQNLFHCRASNSDERDVNQSDQNSIATDLSPIDTNRYPIDFVLVYQKADLDRGREFSFSTTTTSIKARRREFFEANLLKEGLIIEKEEWRRDSPDQFSTRVIFVKVHGTFTALCRYAERLNMKVPLKLRDEFAAGERKKESKFTNFYDFNRYIKQFFKNYFDSFVSFLRPSQAHSIAQAAFRAPTVTRLAATVTPVTRENAAVRKEKPPYVTHRFRRHHMNMYAGIEKSEKFFTPTQRMEIVWEILQNARNDERDEKKRGIELLVQNGIYECAFPLHDGDDHDEERDKSKIENNSNEFKSERRSLRCNWANWKSIAKPQPLNAIRRYYGEKVAFYFAFLGFYTKMLIYPSIIGLITFFWGISASEHGHVCNPNLDPGNRTMCPICQPPNCGFTNLSESCQDPWDYRTDNSTTLVSACFTVVWATVFLKLWKRREAELAYEWDTYDAVEHEDTVLRPEYEQSAPNRRLNPVTRETEPYVSPGARLFRSAISMSVTLLMLSAVGASLVCLAMGRIALYGAFKKAGIKSYIELSRWTINGSIFVIVVVFDFVYVRIASRLTSLECPRTTDKWLSSFLWKVFIFELLNDFIPICYVAWVKGNTVKTPLDMTWYSEMCESSGCMGEVMELVAVLLLAKLVVGNAVEIGVPFMKRIYASTVRFRNQTKTSVRQNCDGKNGRAKQWRSDYLLGKLELDAVAEEYMEMVVQFAYCTLFVPALPLAPLVCLLNNILEIRIDAINLTATHRRPLPVRVAGIGIWNDFYNLVTKLAVFSNAALIAFTSHTVRRLHYTYVQSPNSDFVKSSLSKVPYSSFDEKFINAAKELTNNISECWYWDYRESEHPFDVKLEWWQILCFRMAIFAAFIVASFTFQWFVNFVVDDIPAHVRLKIKRRRYVVAKATEAGSAFDLWLSKAVRRESAFVPKAKQSIPTIFGGHLNQGSCITNESIKQDGSGSQRETTQMNTNSAISMARRWKRATFGDHPRVNVTDHQKTLDAFDIEEEDL